MIQDPLALKILEGEVLLGDHVVVEADLSKRQMVFTVSGRTEAKPASSRQAR
jgi:ATP-dependent Clp protease ATP-binding subunit ClpB